MTPKIPSPLKWLIDKRVRLAGEIRKTRSALATAKQLIEELSKLEDDLAAIDRSLGLHEIQIQVDYIQPIRSHYVSDVRRPPRLPRQSWAICFQVTQLCR